MNAMNNYAGDQIKNDFDTMSGTCCHTGMCRNQITSVIIRSGGNVLSGLKCGSYPNFDNGNDEQDKFT